MSTGLPPERERSATPSACAALRGPCRSPRRSYPYGRARYVRHGEYAEKSTSRRTLAKTGTCARGTRPPGRDQDRDGAAAPSCESTGNQRQCALGPGPPLACPARLLPALGAVRLTLPRGPPSRHLAGSPSPSTPPRSARSPSQAGYTTRQAAYDLRKLRGKQLIDKPSRTRRYHFPPHAARTISALLTLRDHVIAPILAGVRSPPYGPETQDLDRRRPRL